MRCVSRKFGVYEPDNYLDVTGMIFSGFRKGKVVRHYALADLDFTKAFEFINGRFDSSYDDVY